MFSVVDAIAINTSLISKSTKMSLVERRFLILTDLYLLNAVWFLVGRYEIVACLRREVHIIAVVISYGVHYFILGRTDNVNFCIRCVAPSVILCELLILVLGSRSNR